MASKIKTLVVSGPWHNDRNDVNKKRWRVEKITDSVELHPCQFLEHKEVEELCAAAAWCVTIIPIK